MKLRIYLALGICTAVVATVALWPSEPPQTDLSPQELATEQLTTVNVNRGQSQVENSSGLPLDTSTDSSTDDAPQPAVVPTTSARFARDVLPDISQFKQRRYRIAATVNDPYGNQSWEQQIGLNYARDMPLGDYTPKVAVIDSGFALDHDDLSDIWLTNPDESGATNLEADSHLNCSDQQLPLDKSCNVIDDDLNGVIDDETGPVSLENNSLLNCSDQGLPLDKSCNLVDDDSNGLIDDYRGFDFISYERSVMPGETDPDGDGASHGTIVSGVIGAKNNNAQGIAGVNSNVKILPIQALADDGYGYSATVADGIIYATDREVDIISLSLGSPDQDSYLEYAIDYATQRGVTIVAAAGNDGCDCLFYPAGYKPVIAVGAADNSKSLATFSNYGGELDIIAPGVNLISSSWSQSQPQSLYQYASGTSLSTPVVSGLLSRLASHLPTASPLQLKALLFETTDKSGLSIEAIRSDVVGYGFSDAQRATIRATTPLAAEQIVSFDHVRAGGALPNHYPRQEVDRSATAYQCSPNQKPATDVYQLRSGDQTAFSVSEQEVVAAQRAGLTTRKLFSSCLLLPHDQPQTQRTINTLKEFLQISSKQTLH